jgi:EAL domain-containing protein (putative c-di-GMP-specific phosphodiesterase class I)
MRVIVEGVERPEQLELIRKFGGDEIQGYLIGRPTPDPALQLSSLARAASPHEVAPNPTITT